MSHQCTPTKFLWSTLLGILVLAIAGGCLWDIDTLKQERERFPSALEIMVGKFPRHSKAYYEWRIADRTKQLEQHPTDDSLIDDLAVAYDKVGKSLVAIELATQQLERLPTRYETLANLGTFYVHAGDFDNGLTYLREAIKVNPHAHFGRESIQIKLVEYVLSRQVDGQVKLPLFTSDPSHYLDKNGDLERGAAPEGNSFAIFFDNPRQNSFPMLKEQQLDETSQGLLGMMRFSKHNHPILLEALGDIFVGNWNSRVDAKLLAMRAYLLASYGVEDEASKEAYRERARGILKSDHYYEPYQSLTIEEIEKDLQSELSESSNWFEQIEADEQRWIKEGKDVDLEFDRKYRSIQPVEHFSQNQENRDPSLSRRPNIVLSSIVVLVGASMILLFAYVRRRMRRVGVAECSLAGAEND
jgi:tetratricopeptide (TPR) repeat protein